MMKMDDRGSAEYQFWSKRDKMVIFKFDFKSQEDEIMNSLHLLKLKRDQKRGKEGEMDSELQISFLEREAPPSL